MKISKLKVLLASSVVALSLGVASLVNVNAETYFDEKYYTMPTPTGYYDDVDTSLQGLDFINSVGPVISRNFNHHSYKANNTVLKYTDPDPLHPGKVIGFYSGDSISEGSWNKEHVWAKSHGFPSSSTNPYCDAHHLRPTYNNINSRRGNLDFGETNSAPDEYGNRASDVFEPRDEVKGDVARIMFYMEARYKADFHLELVKSRNTSTGSPKFGGLDTLVKWHYADPVSKEEIYRNNVIYDKFQHNRNPYIDHPEWVDLAYPSEYADQTVDQDKVNNVISQINNIPAVITLADKGRIEAAKFDYDKLNYAEKKLVTNYSKLDKALKDLYALENPEKPKPEPDDPVLPDNTEDLVIDFTKSGVKTNSYEKNKSVTVNGLKFTASDLYATGSEFRIGHNKTSTSLGEIGLTGVGSYLEPEFNTKNLKNISIEIPQVYGNPSGWEILFKEENSSIYESVASGKATNGTIAKASLASPRNGKFIFVIEGTKARANLGEYRLGVEAKEVLPPHAFEEVKLEASSFSLNEQKYIRFGTRALQTSFNDASGVGVLVMSTKALKGLDIKKFYNDNELTTVDSLVEKLLNVRIKNYDLTLDLAEVDEAGNLDEAGLYYQFGALINNALGHEDYSFTAIAYIEVNGHLYFTNQVSGSYNSL